MPHAVVVGAGLIGAALAFRLAGLGWRVSVIEAGLPAGGASGASFGWINASFFANPDHFRLRAEGIAAHHRLDADLGGSGVVWSGCLWFEDAGEGFDRQAGTLEGLGYPLRRLDRAQIAAREPNLALPPARALLFPAEGAVDAARLAQRLLTAACNRGAQVCLGTPVTGLITEGAAVTGVALAQGTLTADAVVLAAGTATPALLAALDLALPMLSRPGLLLRTRPAAPLIRHVLVAPGIEVRQDADGALLAPTAAGHQVDGAETVAGLPVELADAAHVRLRRLLPRAPGWADLRLAHRPVPGDGLPLVGPVPGQAGLFIAVLHSGVTLAAVTAEMLSAEIVGQGIAPALVPFRPARLIRPTSAR